MLIYARKVNIRPRGVGRDVQYFDLVRLSDGRCAIINPLLGLEHKDFIRELLTDEQALQRLREWPAWPHNQPDGSHASVWQAGHVWLAAEGRSA
jgi:hypothetical protein